MLKSVTTMSMFAYFFFPKLNVLLCPIQYIIMDHSVSTEVIKIIYRQRNNHSVLPVGLRTNFHLLLMLLG